MWYKYTERNKNSTNIFLLIFSEITLQAHIVLQLTLTLMPTVYT